jgi:sec-independent protein translocase protein TatA
MPDLGVPELLLILAIVVLVFGVGKLPEVGSALGKGIKEFKRATKDEDEGGEKPGSTTVLSDTESTPPPPPPTPPTTQNPQA